MADLMDGPKAYATAAHSARERVWSWAAQWGSALVCWKAVEMVAQSAVWKELAMADLWAHPRVAAKADHWGRAKAFL